MALWRVRLWRERFVVLGLALGLSVASQIMGIVGTANTAHAQDVTVGMPVKISQLVLPGPELEVKPIDNRKAPIILRIVKVYSHGTNFRYDFEWYGLEPGKYDLRDYLQYKDATLPKNLPPMPLSVGAIKPPGQVEPNKLTIDAGPRIGGYRLMLILGGVVWFLGLIGIILSFFFPRKHKKLANAGKPLTMADRLTPLVEGAIAGKLSETELAKLERSLMTYWRHRLKLEQTEPIEAMQAMRNHTDAGPLLVQLETWLHKPGTHGSVNVAELLKPYRDLPHDAMELGESS